MSTPGSQVRITAADRRRGMTVGELRRVLELADRIELPDTGRVIVEVGWKSQLQSIELQREDTRA